MLPKLHYISQEPHLELIESSCKAGCQLVQLRAKNITPNQYLELAVRAKEITEKYGAKLIVNDIPEIAQAVRAYGVHLGQEDMSPKEARKIVGRNMIIGGSTNSFEDIQRMVESGVDYVGLGPFRFTSTKDKLNPVLGLNGIETVMYQVRKEGITIPVIAIGGIEAEDVQPLLETGVYGVAVSGTISKQADKTGVVSAFLKQLK